MILRLWAISTILRLLPTTSFLICFFQSGIELSRGSRVENRKFQGRLFSPIDDLS